MIYTSRSRGDAATSQPWHISAPSPDTASDSVEVVTYKQAIAQIGREMKSCLRVAVYSFNVRLDELESAYALLDTLEGRKSMRITYNDEYNFIVKFMPGIVYEISHTFWSSAFNASLMALTGRHEPAVLGCMFVGATRFTLSPARKKEGDTCICPIDSDSPTVVIEVGDSESLTQLKMDAKLWLESPLLHVRLVVIICIDPPLAAHPNLPRITIQHWKPFPPTRPPRAGSHARQIEGRKVWEADWTHAVTNYYILLADVFPAAIPVIYGAATRLVFSPAILALWRQQIIDRWQ